MYNYFEQMRSGNSLSGAQSSLLPPPPPPPQPSPHRHPSQEDDNGISDTDDD